MRWIKKRDDARQQCNKIKMRVHWKVIHLYFMWILFPQWFRHVIHMWWWRWSTFSYPQPYFRYSIMRAIRTFFLSAILPYIIPSEYKFLFLRFGCCCNVCWRWDLKVCWLALWGRECCCCWCVCDMSTCVLCNMHIWATISGFPCFHV